MAKTKLKRIKKQHTPLVFPAHGTVRWPADVLALLNASAQAVDWDDRQQALNAAVRCAFARFAPPTLQIEVSPFEQLVFAPTINHIRK